MGDDVANQSYLSVEWRRSTGTVLRPTWFGPADCSSMTDNAFDPFDLDELDSSKEGYALTEADFVAQVDSDPFGIADLAEATSVPPAAQEPERKQSPSLPPEVSRVTRSNISVASSKLALPPKLVVKLALFEEVVSEAVPGREAEGACQVSIEGTIYTQVQCSDAMKNAPFNLDIVGSPRAKLRPNSKFTTISPSSTPIVTVPKQEIGYVPVAYYNIKELIITHMPILVERKVTFQGTTCRMAIQVRSKLSNLGNMEDFSIAMAIPEKVNPSSVVILRGDGEWDELKRMCIWKLPLLNKGESFMVSAQALLRNTPQDEDETIHFPVMLRCSSSADQISTVSVDAAEAEGYPSSLTANFSRSFRLMHRLA